MKVKIDYTDSMAFKAHTDSGHNIRMDSSPEVGGHNTGARPMELLLAGLGGCTSIDVMMILRKSRQQVSDCRIIVEGLRSEHIPRVFTHISVHFIVSGKQLDSKKVERAIKLSAEKYCSASIMLGKSAKITHSWEITETIDL